METNLSESVRYNFNLRMLRLSVTLLCVFGVINAKHKTNLVVFGDNVLEDRIEHLTELATEIAKDSDNEIGLIRLVSYNLTTNWSLIASQMQTWIKGDKKPDVILDLTKDHSTHYIKQITRNLKLPVISTNQHPMTMAMTMLKSWIGLTKEESKYFVQVGSPFWKLETILNAFQVNTLMPHTIVFDGKRVGSGIIYLNSNGTLSRIYMPTFIATNYTVLPRVIPMSTQSVNGVFLIGGKTYIENILKGTDKLDKHLFDDKIAWYAATTEFGSTIECPKSMTRGIIVINPTPTVPEKRLKETLKVTKTKNITELFYLDMILGAVRAVGAMKADDSKVSFGFRAHLANELKLDSNYLGSYHFSSKLGVFQANLPLYNLELVKYDQDAKQIGQAIFDEKLGFKMTDEKAYAAHAPMLYFNATVVVDEPFVIRNETCIKEKLSSDKLLSCYYGYVIDVLHKILQELKRIRISVIKEGKYGSNSEGATHDMALIERHKNSKTVSSLSQIGIGAFSIDSKQNRSILLTHPIYKDSKADKVYSIALDPIQGVLLYQFSHMIKKLENQRYLEQLKETWFVEHKCKNCKPSEH